VFKRVLISALLVLVAASPAWAQAAKVDVSVLFGYTLADGVSGSPYKAGDGNTYDRVDPKDSMMFAISGGFFATPSVEIGFMWRHQPTTIQVSGSKTTDVADMNINGYHAFFAYYFGDPEGKVRPYVMGGLGATSYGAFSFQGTNGTRQVSGNTQFSSTWGGGVKVYASPKVGFQAGLQWTPTYIKTDATGLWCDPYWGCFVTGDAQYSNQFEFAGGITFRF
jgi:outer membrane protein W